MRLKQSTAGLLLAGTGLLTTGSALAATDTLVYWFCWSYRRLFSKNSTTIFVRTL
jgi:hypothetical protein